MDAINNNQISGDDFEALVKLVPPATRCDRPGEMYVDACKRLLGTAFARLTERGLLAVGIGPTSAPARVIAFYEEFSPRTRLMADTIGRGGNYDLIVSITDAGWSVVEACALKLPLPPWAETHIRIEPA